MVGKTEHKVVINNIEFAIKSERNKIEQAVSLARKLITEFVPVKLIPAKKNEIVYHDGILSASFKVEVRKHKFKTLINYSTESNTVSVRVAGLTSTYLYNIINQVLSKQSSHIPKMDLDTLHNETSTVIRLRGDTPYSAALNLVRKTFALLRTADYIKAENSEDYIKEINKSLDRKRLPILHKTAVLVLPSIAKGVEDSWYRSLLLEYVRGATE